MTFLITWAYPGTHGDAWDNFRAKALILRGVCHLMTGVGEKMSKPESSGMLQKKYEVTVALLVRLNLNALLRDLATKDLIWNRYLQEYKSWLDSDPLGRDPYAYSDEELLRFKNFGSESDYQQWSMSQLAQRLYTLEAQAGKKSLVGRVRKVLSSVKSKGSSALPIEEVVRFAIEVGISPGSLLNPLVEWLEEDSILRFVNFGPTPLEISALDWYLYVNGLAGIQGVGYQGHRLQMMNFSAKPGLWADSSKPYFLNEEEERMQSSKSSPVIPPVGWNGWSYIEGQGDMNQAVAPSPHPLDSMVPPTSYMQRVHARTRASINLLNILRHLFIIGNSKFWLETRKEDIEWHLNQMRVVLSELSINAAPVEPTITRREKYVGKQPQQPQQPQQPN